MSDSNGLYQQLVASAVVLIFGVVIVNSLVGASVTTATDEARFDGGPNINPAAFNVTSAQESLGTALALSGGASQVQADIPETGPGDIEFCTYVAVGNTDANVTVATANGDVTIQYHGNRSIDRWVGVRYDEALTARADVTATATTPDHLTHVCVRQASGTVTLALNGTDVASTPINSSSTAPNVRANTTALNGTLEETRLYDDNLTAGERNTLVTSPTAPIDRLDPVARLYYDSRKPAGASVSSTPVYFATTTADITGGTVTAGFDGRGAAPEDVILSDDGKTATARNGSNLDGQPTAFISYQAATGGGALLLRVSNTLETAFILVPIVLIAALAAAAIGLVPGVAGLRGGPGG